MYLLDHRIKCKYHCLVGDVYRKYNHDQYDKSLSCGDDAIASSNYCRNVRYRNVFDIKKRETRGMQMTGQADKRILDNTQNPHPGGLPTKSLDLIMLLVPYYILFSLDILILVWILKSIDWHSWQMLIGLFAMILMSGLLIQFLQIFILVRREARI